MANLFDLYGGVELDTLSGSDGFYVVETDSSGDPVRSRFVTLDTLKTFINTDPSVAPSSNPWRGCRVNLTSNQSISNATYTSVIWHEAALDTDSIWSIAAPTRLTVPSGVTKVCIRANTSWALNSGGQRFMSLQLNGATPDGALGATTNGSDSALSADSAHSSVLEVSAGDYFELRVRQSSGSDLNLFSDSRTWFELEIVEASA